MVVSDLGLTTLSGDDGVHAMVRSLSTAAPLAGVELRLVARNNEVLATKTTGADGRVDFDPGLSRGTGGLAPGLLVATLADDYGFLNLTQAAFDLTDRGVAGRDAPGALDAFLYTERGVYRSGETVYVAALLRDAKGAAEIRPAADAGRQAPRRRRIQARDRRRPGPRRPLAQRCRWRRTRRPAHGRSTPIADPKAPAIGHAQFLLEDYVPERLDYQLKPGVAFADRRRADPRLARRALSLWRAGRRPRRDRRDPPQGRRRRRSCPAIPAIVAGLVDEEFEPVEVQFPDKAQTDDKGHADLSIDLPEGDAVKPLEARIIVDVAESGGRTVERVVTLPVRAKGRDDRRQEGFRRRSRQRRGRDLRGDRRGAGRRRAAAQERRLVALQGQQRLPMVQRRRPLELRAGQILASKLADGTFDIAADAPAKISAPGRAGASIGST